MPKNSIRSYKQYFAFCHYNFFWNLKKKLEFKHSKSIPYTFGSQYIQTKNTKSYNTSVFKLAFSYDRRHREKQKNWQACFTYMPITDDTR